MDNTTKRRASESEATKALALISTQQSNRIPPPLPYLPSDYRPSSDSPRHFIVSPLYAHQNSANTIGKRQRSRSIDYPLAIENNALVASTSSNLVARHNREHFELVPYREWTVIARNNQKGQLVLYNQDSQSVTVQKYLPDHYSTIDPNAPIQLKSDEGGSCPYCHRPMISTATTSESKNDEPDFMDRNYFRLLASSQANTASNSPVQSRSSTFSSDAGKQAFDNQNLNANAFNQGYYSKFFVEVNKLGKGFRGSVFLCEHMLDGVKLGKYAIKKVAIGNNHPWLVRMLREVHLLERLRHPNIVSYKHSWLEYNRLTPFGPEVPCLFILMECANGGNLEEYFEPKSQPNPQPSTQQSHQERRKSTKELKRERIRRQYQAQELFEKDQDISSPVTDIHRRLLTMTEIWSLFLDIVQGLAHLHQQNIVHRDLKPPNLLLQYDDRNRHGQQGIPRVLISDFGECEDLDETTIDSNRTGATGTLEFMAPEHVRLDPRGRNTVDYSPKADMWSLGMVLYFLCYSRLPYSVIDDIDLLRSEILSFKDVRFPVSRFDIYKPDSAMYNEAIHNPNLSSDIPNELKLLIRMLLSVDPSKRPSCNEILSKLRSFRRDDHAAIFQDIPSEWRQPSPTPSPPVSSPSPPPTSSMESVAENPTATTLESSSPELIAGDNFGDEPSFKKHRLGSVSTEDSSTHSSTSSSNHVLRKRQRLLSGRENTMMDDDPVTSIEEEPVSPPRLLLGSPDFLVESNNWLTERYSMQAIKTGTAILKIASCTYSCSPYSTKPSILYPVIFFATLDFWNESSSPSFMLLIIHIFWITSTTLWTGGLCTA